MLIALTVLVVVLLIAGYVIMISRSAAAVRQARTERNAIYRNCYLRGLAGLLAKMAKADGEATDDETSVVVTLFKDMALSDADNAVCLEAYRVAKSSPVPGSYYASLFVPYSTHESRMLIYEVLWDIAAADKRFAAGEETFLRDLLRWLELDPALYDHNLHAHARKFANVDEAIRSAGARLTRACS